MWPTDTLTAPAATPAPPTVNTLPPRLLPHRVPPPARHVAPPARALAAAELTPATPVPATPAQAVIPPMPTVPPLLVASPLAAPQLTTTAPQLTPRRRRTQAAPLPRRRRSSCAPATTFEAALTDLAAQAATGVLHGPDGAVHLAAGLVVHAESARGASVGHLLTGAGRITLRAWEESVALGGGHPADHLLAAGLVGTGELELARLAATLDGAQDALAQHSVELRFDPAARPAFQLARPLSVLELRGAVGRRRALLDACWPSAELDSVPPVATGAAPTRRTAVPRRRRQALLAAADGIRTAPELARLLGRSTFGTLLDVRQLAAAGLLASGRPAVLPDPPPAAGPQSAPPDAPGPVPMPPGPRSYDSSDPEVGLLLRLRAALEAL
ncbi:hypothetical protein ACIHEI_25130 [Kitasatospora sp. NPDC051984]|uniref:hypothetical protein n=1 Tax=Kitasatospora sp. NPDC051984 TaxID=3364059 RepID=UPI0037C875B9